MLDGHQLTSTQGLDLDKLATKKRFLFIDGLSSLFLPSTSRAAPRDDPSLIQGNDLARIASKIKNAIQALRAQGGNVVLVVDGLDFLLASSMGDGRDGVTASGLGEAVMELRQVCEVVPWRIFISKREVGCSTWLMDYIGCAYHNPYTLRRYTARNRTKYTSGNKPRFLPPQHSTPSRSGYRTETARYWCGQGCQWSYEDKR